MTRTGFPFKRVTLAAVLGSWAETVAITEVRENSGLEVGGDFGGGGKWSDTSYILKPLEFAERPGVD